MAGDLARSSVLIVLMKLISPLDGGMWLAVVEFSAVRDRYSRFSPRYSLIPPPLVFDHRLLFTPNLFKNLILTRKSSSQFVFSLFSSLFSPSSIPQLLLLLP